MPSRTNVFRHASSVIKRRCLGFIGGIIACVVRASVLPCSAKRLILRFVFIKKGGEQWVYGIQEGESELGTQGDRV